MAALVTIGVLALAFPAPAMAVSPVDYADPSSWLCLPGRDDVCSKPLTSTEVPPTAGPLIRKTYTPDPGAPIDCFYVYPTVSPEPTANADMIAGPQETRAAREQFARFGAKCRTYAPIYRQTTVAAMRGDADGADTELAYQDVLAAWRYYLAHDNHGRGVVLIGHSQGGHHLARLIAEEIDGKPVQRLLVSAIVTGANVEVPHGAETGGIFHDVRLCRSAGQTGCVIAYSSFLADDPPGPGAPFGRADESGMDVACVNPAELLGRGDLDSELLATPQVARVLGTDMVENPGTISAACTVSGDASFLAITVKPVGASAAALKQGFAKLDRQWGLHPLDINLALGDLVEIVGRQSKAWAAAQK